MANVQWKVDERKVAKAVGGRRIALSGGRGAASKADVLCPGWFIEVKRRVRFSAARWLGAASVKAAAEGRRPVVVIHVAGSNTWLALLSLEDWQALTGLRGDEVRVEGGKSE